jgi:hypothetical protein
LNQALEVGGYEGVVVGFPNSALLATGVPDPWSKLKSTGTNSVGASRKTIRNDAQRPDLDRVFPMGERTKVDFLIAFTDGGCKL